MWLTRVAYTMTFDSRKFYDATARRRSSRGVVQGQCWKSCIRISNQDKWPLQRLPKRTITSHYIIVEKSTFYSRICTFPFIPCSTSSYCYVMHEPGTFAVNEPSEQNSAEHLAVPGTCLFIPPPRYTTAGHFQRVHYLIDCQET